MPVHTRLRNVCGKELLASVGPGADAPTTEMFCSAVCISVNRCRIQTDVSKTCSMGYII